MGFFIKLLISVLIVAAFIVPVVDWSRDSAWSAFFFPMLTFPWLVHALLTLYTDQPRDTRLDARGNLSPVYRARSSRRARLGRMLFFGTGVAMLVLMSLPAGVITSDIVYAPLMVTLQSGAYLLLTPRCIYCYRSYVPKDERCPGCGSVLSAQQGHHEL